MAHTPGPWKRVNETLVDFITDGKTIICIAPGGEHYKSAEAWRTYNASLIVACPDMFDALLMVLSSKDDVSVIDFDRIEQVVAKASGKEFSGVQFGMKKGGTIRRRH